MGILYIVATPIGNLEDITIRALNVLKEVDLILCEDTRVTKILLGRYDIKTPTLSYHQHSKLQKIDYIIELLKEGKNLALVSDAGTPGISDPGQQLISVIKHNLSSARVASPNDRSVGRGTDGLRGSPSSVVASGVERSAAISVEIIPIPGPNAAIAALSISGFPTDEFLFLGFPPHKKGRQTFFENVLIEAEKRTVVFYESTHRIIKALDQLVQSSKFKVQSEDEKKYKKIQVVVCRELTKKFETIYRGTSSEVLEKLKGGIIKGEFVVVVKIL